MSNGDGTEEVLRRSAAAQEASDQLAADVERLRIGVEGALDGRERRKAPA
jgi:hypothetical protein